MQQLNKSLLFQSIRQFVYVIFVLLLILFVRAASYSKGASLFDENGLIENMQLEFLLLSSFVFIVSAFIHRAHKALFLLFAALCAFAACRELDCTFDRLMPVISWKFGYVFVLLALLNVKYRWNEFIPSLNRFLSSPAFFMMIMALTVALPIAQAVGDKRIVTNVLGLAQMRETKELFEEHCELIGYFILLLSSFECYLNFKKPK